jgi:predicted phage tail protein
MGWGNSGPANCDSPYNGRIPAFHSTNIYFPSVKLTAGTYEWSVRAYDGTNYSGFITPIRFTVKAYVAPPPPPPPPCTTCGPGPDPEPDPDPNAGPVDGGGYIDSGDITSTVEEIADDKEAPSIPGNLQGEFSPDDNTIHLTWDASTDNTQLNGYEVERTEKGTEKWEAIGNVSTEEFDDFEFEPQKTYQYRVRAVDAQENKSAYSNVVDIIAGEFFPNVKAKEGGTVNIDNVILEFPNGSVDEDLFVTAEKVQKPKIKFGDNTKLVGDVWEVKAKNEKGDSVTQFKTQITLRIKYTKNQISGVTESTIKLANFSNDKIKLLSTKLDRKAREAKTLTDHFSIYILVANKTGAWATFLKIILWIMLLGAIGFGIYYLYVLYQRREYQKVHQYDYIYRS